MVSLWTSTAAPLCAARIQLKVRLLGALACIGIGACSQRTPAPGPVPLRSKQQVHAFLSGQRIVATGDDSLWWQFEEDGTFQAQCDLHVPQEADPYLLRGRWSVTLHRLELSDLDPGPVGEAELSLPLGWVDGKLRIEVDGRRYQRR